jgi:hypothetical protein
MEETTAKTEQPTAMSVGFKYGLILGLISIVLTIIFFVVGMNPFEGGWKSWLNTCLAILFVVLAHKNFKDNGDGFMSYGQGLGIAMVTFLVSMVVSGIFSYIYLQFIDPSAFEQIWEKAAADMEAKGQSQDQIDVAMSWGRKLFWVFFIVGGAFIGLLIGLVVSIFTQKKAPEQAF